MRRTRWTAILILAALTLGACGAETADTAPSLSDVDTAVAPAAPEPTEETVAGDLARGQVSDAAVVDRKVIRTGQINIQAEDTRAAMETITAVVERSGGFVASSNVSPTDGDRQPIITLTVRIPAGEMGNTLAAIREIADEVISESTDSLDVTEEYVDLEANLRNLKALETELLALLAEVRQQDDADPAKLLQVFNEVSRVRGEIEVLEGRMRFLDNQVALSTLTIGIEPVPISQPIVEDTWQPVLTVRNAVGRLIETLQDLVDVGIWLLVFALPVVLVVTLPITIPLLVVWRRRKVRPAATPAAPVPAAVAAPGEVAGETPPTDSDG